MLSDIQLAAGIVFGERRYLLLAALLSMACLLVYVSIPVLTVPGNSYEFLVLSTPLPELLAIGALSALMGLTMSMQAFCWKNSIGAAKGAGVGFAGFISGAVGSLFASASCAGCVSAVFSFVGFGGVLFLIEHKAEVTALTLGVVFLSLYFTSKRIAGKCDYCSVPDIRKKGAQPAKGGTP